MRVVSAQHMRPLTPTQLYRPHEETRALAISVFYALGTAIGGSFAPTLFGWLIESGSNWRVSAGYAAAGVLKLGIDAEQKSLESIAAPLSSQG
jgi:MFS family permease